MRFTTRHINTYNEAKRYYSVTTMEVFVIAVITLVSLIYIHYKRSFRYWESKGVATIKPRIPFGNLDTPFISKGGFILKLKSLHQEIKAKGEKFGGLYIGTTPMLLVVHPEAVKDVLCKDFVHFNSHGISVNEEHEPLQAHLFTMDGEKWKDMRVKLTPTFTSGKMKMMFQTLLDCGEQFKEFLDKCHEQNKALDIKEILSCYTTDVIGSCAFGLECNSFKNPDAQFRNYGRKLFQPKKKFQIRRLLGMIAPALLKFVKVNFVDKETSDFFIGVVKDMVDYRQSNKVTRNDFMQLLINMEEQAKLEGKEGYTIKQIAAQAFIFFLAGFETSSTTMTFCLYELAHNHEIQDKVREEINQIIQKHNGKLTYDGIMEMKYLDQVINETLRKYPPLHALPRMCTKNYKLANGAEIEKGVKVSISVLALQRDPEYYPNPEKFDPDRFSDENKQNIAPYTFLPFGEGPRICIGLRFGVMQTKVGISLLLKNYKISPHKSVTYPLEFDENAPVLTGKGTILLTTQKI